MEKEDLFNYLKGLSAEERKKFYEEAEKAAQKFTPEGVKITQGQRLFDLGFGELFKMSKNEFLSEIPLPKEGRGRILVVSAKYVSPEISMTLIKVDGKCGKNYLNLDFLEDTKDARVPRGMFYWRYGLDYKTCRGKSSTDSLELILKANRFPGAANEAIYVVAQHPGILLKEIWLDCPGSRSDRVSVPYFFLCDGGPRLDAGYASGGPRCGSFSFGE